MLHDRKEKGDVMCVVIFLPELKSDACVVREMREMREVEESSKTEKSPDAVTDQRNSQ